MRGLFLCLAGLWMISFVSGCAGISNPDFESPVVSLQSFRVIPGQSITPKFEITLHVLNPNRDPLDFEGIFYIVDIEGYEVLAGVSNTLPTIEPYGEADIVLEAGVDLIKSIKLISSLMQQPRDQFTYGFKAKLDPGGMTREIRIQEEGEFNLRADR